MADDAVILSGPQPGESLVAFTASGTLGIGEGKPVDVVTAAAGKPVLIIFVHEPLNRYSTNVTRILTEYAASLEHKLSSLVVVLHADRAVAEDLLRQTRASLRWKSPVAVSLDGAQGPAAYGLNRQVNLTVIVGKQHLVTGNFALVQPTAADVPAIITEIARAAGVDAPTPQQVDLLLAGSRDAAPSPDPDKP